MDRQTRNRIVRWMNDHFIHYANARGLAEACAEALNLAAERGHCGAEAIYHLACDYYPEKHF
jgi:hypothetical protein